MTTIRVGPPVVNKLDILEYAHALIEEHGWRQGPRVPDTEDWPEVAKNGLSLHDAIGMACFVLSGETGRAHGKSHTSSKDYPTHGAHDYGYSGTLREMATAAVQKHLQSGETDITFNDRAQDGAAVMAVLEAAIQEVQSGSSD